MNLPKSAVLAQIEESDKDYSAPLYSTASNAKIAESMGLVESVEGLVVPEIPVFNDYVAVMLCKRKSTIALTGVSEYSNIGIIVGIGTTCLNKFKLGQQVVYNGKPAAVVGPVEELPPEYTVDGAKRAVVLIMERNIFYGASGTEKATVTPFYHVSKCNPGCCS